MNMEYVFKYTHCMYRQHAAVHKSNMFRMTGVFIHIFATNIEYLIIKNNFYA